MGRSGVDWPADDSSIVYIDRHKKSSSARLPRGGHLRCISSSPPDASSSSHWRRESWTGTTSGHYTTGAAMRIKRLRARSTATPVTPHPAVHFEADHAVSETRFLYYRGSGRMEVHVSFSATIIQESWLRKDGSTRLFLLRCIAFFWV